MCVSPITIPSTRRFVSLSYKDKMLYTFGCGHCCECVSIKSNQMTYRVNYEFDDLPKNGYVYFDCLTYRNADLPHLSDFWSVIDKKDDYPCFNRLHVRRFLQALRLRLIRAGYSKNAFRYFYACEYGTSSIGTHRPHIHLMFFVHDERLQPLEFSRIIADVWKFGRTDGYGYKPNLYILTHNVIKPCSQASRLRTIQYITKYMQKTSEFSKVLRKRVAVVMRKLAEFACCYSENILDGEVVRLYDEAAVESWLESEIARRERLKLLRMVNEYYSTSQNFGLSALSEIDLNELFDTGCLFMPHSGKFNVAVPLPLYYKRKMFYEMVEVDGARYWQLNDLGKEYVLKRHDALLKDTLNRLHSLSLMANIKVDEVELSKYVVDERGTIKAAFPSNGLQDVLENLDFYNYSSCSDKLQFGCRGLSVLDLGSSQIGYKTNELEQRVAMREFIEKYVYLNQDYEHILSKLDSSVSNIRKKKQEAYEVRQRLGNLFKSLCP